MPCLVHNYIPLSTLDVARRWSRLKSSFLARHLHHCPGPDSGPRPTATFLSSKFCTSSNLHHLFLLPSLPELSALFQIGILIRMLPLALSSRTLGSWLDLVVRGTYSVLAVSTRIKSSAPLPSPAALVRCVLVLLLLLLPRYLKVIRVWYGVLQARN